MVCLFQQARFSVGQQQAKLLYILCIYIYKHIYYLQTIYKTHFMQSDLPKSAPEPHPQRCVTCCWKRWKAQSRLFLVWGWEIDGDCFGHLLLFKSVLLIPCLVSDRSGRSVSGQGGVTYAPALRMATAAPVTVASAVGARPDLFSALDTGKRKLEWLWMVSELM